MGGMLEGFTYDEMEEIRARDWQRDKVHELEHEVIRLKQLPREISTILVCIDLWRQNGETLDKWHVAEIERCLRLAIHPDEPSK